MKYLLALCLSFGQIVNAAPAADPLKTALDELRGRIAFVDLTPEGRMADVGANLAMFGISAVSAGVAGTGGIPTPLEVVMGGVQFVAIFAAGVGTVMFASGKVSQLLFPRPKLVVASPREYMSAPGLNQFMALSKRRQYEVASTDPELSAYLLKLADAYRLAKHFKLIPPDPAMSAFY